MRETGLTQAESLQTAEIHRHSGCGNRERIQHPQVPTRRDWITHFLPEQCGRKGRFKSQCFCLFLGKGKQQHLESKDPEIFNEGKTFAQSCQQTENPQTHIQQKVEASQHQTFSDVFIVMTHSNPAGVPGQLECNPTALIRNKTEEMGPTQEDNR